MGDRLLIEKGSSGLDMQLSRPTWGGGQDTIKRIPSGCVS